MFLTNLTLGVYGNMEGDALTVVAGDIVRQNDNRETSIVKVKIPVAVVMGDMGQDRLDPRYSYKGVPQQLRKSWKMVMFHEEYRPQEIEQFGAPRPSKLGARPQPSKTTKRRNSW
jgi:hypothetical protein